FVNLPLGLFALWMVIRRFREPKLRTRKHRIDYAGSIALTMGLALLLAALLAGGSEWGWSAPATILALCGALVAFVAFVLIERRASRPCRRMWGVRYRGLLRNTLVALRVGRLRRPVTL